MPAPLIPVSVILLLILVSALTGVTFYLLTHEATLILFAVGILLILFTFFGHLPRLLRWFKNLRREWKRP